VRENPVFKILQYHEQRIRSATDAVGILLRAELILAVATTNKFLDPVLSAQFINA